MATETKRQFDDTGKVVFDDYYNRPDPRMYFRTLGELDYRIAGEAQPVFRRVIDALREQRNITDVKTVDLGCSYGINAALLKHDLDLNDLNEHYMDPSIADWSRAQVLERDIPFYREHRTDSHLFSVGIDPAEHAINYALDAGVLDEGFVKDLEEEAFDAREAKVLRDVDLVMSTGCIGYVTETSVKRILDAIDQRRPWMAHAVLRMFSFEPYKELLEERGYVTEQMDGTLLQRRFASDEEKANVYENLAELGVDPEGKESEGWYHANFFLSRPAEEARTPVKLTP